MSIHAIETHYNGYRFRSRLEARWAVFFDVLGYTWEYEKEGFDIDGTWYLPDFWLVDIGCWAEVKARPLLPIEMHSCRALGCILLIGLPEVDWYIHLGSPTYHWYGVKEYGENEIVPFGCLIHLEHSLFKGRPWYCYGEGIEAYDNDRFETAVTAARSARFERRIS